MIVLGIILALIGFLAGISVLLWIGVVLIVIGLVFNFAPGLGTRSPYGGRWY